MNVQAKRPLAPFKWDEFNKPGGKRFALLNELRNIPGVQQLSLGSGAPSSAGWSSQTLTFADGKKNIETDARAKSGDTNFFNLYNINYWQAGMSRPTIPLKNISSTNPICIF